MQNRILIVLVVVVVAIVAAGAGFFYGTSVGEARANDVVQRLMQGRNLPGQGGFTGMSGQPGQGNPGQFMRQGTTGTVKSISGNTIEVSASDRVVTVVVGDQTVIQKQVSGSLGDIQVGTRVVVTGEPDSSGKIAARTIQVLPAALR